MSIVDVERFGDVSDEEVEGFNTAAVKRHLDHRQDREPADVVRLAFSPSVAAYLFWRRCAHVPDVESMAPFTETLMPPKSEPSLEDILAEPIFHQLMRADGVHSSEIIQLFRKFGTAEASLPTAFLCAKVLTKSKLLR